VRVRRNKAINIIGEAPYGSYQTMPPEGTFSLWEKELWRKSDENFF
jgi:hypothetical protein